MRGVLPALVSLCLPAVLASAEQPDPPPPSAEVHLAAVGDVFFGRYLPGPGGQGKVYSAVSTAPDPFAPTADILQQADVTFGNLETPVMWEPERFYAGRLTFRADPDRAGLLARAGFDVLSLANNHVTNLGTRGARETRQHVEAQGVRGIGAGASIADAYEPQIYEVNGLRLCFLAYTLWNNRRLTTSTDGTVAYVRHRDFLQRVPRVVRKARRELHPDFVIVSLHWGTEYEPHPDEQQRVQAHALVDAGADLVLGHHPHVLQDFERYRGALIAYSLGNFLFDNPSLNQRQTVILQATLSRSGTARQIKDVSLLPVLADVHGKVPRPATGRDYRELARKLYRLAPGFPLRPDPARRPGPEMVLRLRQH